MISIVVPMHNASSHIKRCLECIRQLKYNDYEVILVDDGSTDDSCAIAQGLGVTPIRINAARGPSWARNLGARQAKGELLFFVDADVCLNPDTLNRLEFLIKKYPSAAGVTFIYSLEHPNKDLVSLHKNFSVRTEEMSKPDFSSGFRFSAFAVKKEAFDAIGGFDTALCCEELEFSLKLNKHGFVFFIDKDMNIIHAKKYTFMELIKGDFYRGYNYFMIFLKNYRQIKNNYSKIKGNFHIPIVQLAGVGIALISLISLIFYPAKAIPAACLLLAAVTLVVSQAKFLRQAHSAYGMKFSAVSFLLKNMEIAIGEIVMVFVLVGVLFKKKAAKCLSI